MCEFCLHCSDGIVSFETANLRKKYLRGQINFENLPKQPDDVVAIGQNNQSHHDDESHCFSHFHELVGRLAPRDDFDQQEQDMATIQSRNGQNVHHGEGDGEESGHAPEKAPNPSFRENLAYANEAAHAFVSLGLGAEDELHLFPIVAKFLEGLGETCGNGF